MKTTDLSFRLVCVSFVALALLLFAGVSGCDDDDSDDEAADAVGDVQETLDSEDADTEDGDTADGADGDAEEDGDAEDGDTADGDGGESEDGSTLTPLEQVILDGCQAFDRCGLIDQFGGTVERCQGLGAQILENAPECKTEVEDAFGCAADQQACDIETACESESQALASCTDKG